MTVASSADTPDAVSSVPDGAWPLAGRDAQLQAVLAGVRASTICAVVLSGEAGVGKTRLAAEAASVLEGEGWRVRRVAANTALASVPLAALLPLVGDRGIELGAIDSGTESLMRFATQLALQRDGAAPLLVVVDDIPQLDALSVAVLAQLASSGAATLLATVRDGEPLPDAIAALWTSDHGRRIALAPLDLEQTSDLLGSVLGATVAHQSVVALHSASGGNPLFLRELVAHARSTQALHQHQGTWTLTGKPGGSAALGELIARRLDSLDAASRDVIERLAVCRTIPIDQFDRANERAALDTLEQRQLVQVRHEAGRFVASVAHPQYAHAVATSVSTLRRLEVLLDHADRAAQSSSPLVDAVRIATWRLEAGAPAQLDLVESAVRLAALAEDFALVERLGAAAVASGTKDPELLVTRADALVKLGRLDEALSALDDAKRLDDATVDDGEPRDEHRTARILSMRATTLLARGDRTGEVLAELDAALDALPAANRRLQLTRSRLLIARGEPRGALDALENAGEGDSPAEQGPLDVALTIPLVALGRATEAVAAGARAVAAARAGDAGVPLRVALLMHSLALRQSGEFEAARLVAAEALAESISVDDEFRTRQAEFSLAQCWLGLGRLETAARWFGDVVVGARTRGPASYEVHGRAGLAWVRAQQGQSDAAAAHVHAIDPAEFGTELGWVAAAWAESLTGIGTAARAALVRAGRSWLERGDLDKAVSVGIECARMGDPRSADELLSELDPPAGSALLHLRVRTVRALAHPELPALESLSLEWEALGSIVLAAECAALAGESAALAGAARDAARLLGRARALAERTEGALTAPLHHKNQLEPLTPREREIAAQAARGVPSNDIAARLFLSPRTVNNHLQSAYTKLGVRRRSELAAALGLAVDQAPVSTT